VKISKVRKTYNEDKRNRKRRREKNFMKTFILFFAVVAGTATLSAHAEDAGKFPRGNFPGGPGGPPPFLSACESAMSKCEGKDRGPEHMRCLEEHGSDQCKTALKKARENMAKHRMGRPGN